MNFRVGNVAFTRPRPPARSAGAPPCADRAVACIAACTSIHPEPPATVAVDELYGVPPAAAARPAVGRALHDRQPRRHDGRRRPLGRPRQRHRHAPCSAPCGGPPTSSSSAPARRAARATARRSKPGQRIGVVTDAGDVDPPTPSCSPAAPGSSSCPRTAAPTPAGDRRRAGRPRPGRPRRSPCAASATSSTPPAFVQAEGGPHLNGALLAGGCVDELDLTISPVLAGGDGARVVAGGAADARPLRPRPPGDDDDGYLYGRWVRRRG